MEYLSSDLELRLINKSQSRTRDQLAEKLEAASTLAGEGKPIGIGTIFYMDMRWRMLAVPNPEMEDATMARASETGQIGTWKGHPLYIIPRNLVEEGLDDPRPWEPPKPLFPHRPAQKTTIEGEHP